MFTPQGNNITGQGLFSLPSELRNTIYEYVSGNIQDSMELHLENGPNRKHRITPKSWKTLSENARCKHGKPTFLNLLLTCKQISKEATGIAYGQLSLTLDSVFGFPRTRTKPAFDEADARMVNMLVTYAKTFRATARSQITKMHIRSPIMIDLLSGVFLHTNRLTHPHPATEGCTDKCHKFPSHSGSFHTAFHNIRQITVDSHITGSGSEDSTYRSLKTGASWLSFVMPPDLVPRLLGVFPNLEEIVVRRKSGKQQVSIVRDGKVFAAESGMPLGGCADWS